MAFARNENAIEGAPHIGILGRRLTPENATLVDKDVLAVVDFRVNRTLDNETVAGGDLTRESCFRPDNHGPDINFVARGLALRLGLV